MKKYILTEDQLEDLLSDSLNMDYVYHQDPTSTLSTLNKYDNEERGEDIRICLGDYEVYQDKDLKPDWKDAPEDATHLAMDEDGQWCWYFSKPVVVKKWGIFENVDDNVETETCLIKGWEYTLEERPSKASKANKVKEV